MTGHLWEWRHVLLLLLGVVLAVYFGCQYLVLARRKWESEEPVTFTDDLILLACCGCYELTAAFVFYAVYGVTLLLTGLVDSDAFVDRVGLWVLVAAIVTAPGPLMLIKRVAKARWEQ